MKSGIEIISEERNRQLETENWNAAVCYASFADRKPFIDGKSDAPALWPWSHKWWKPSPRDRVRELAKAGALIAAEIDRIQREENNQQ